ncbi:MAG: M13 family metallopeptidase [Erysipelotrichaceae bacterium]|nr:M13 family metallopeptidase [Erysipelotrichaceae bacterium]
MEKVRIQDDLFQNVNGEKLEKLVIPDDKFMAGGFAQLMEDVENIMLKDFAAFLNGEKAIPENLPEVKEAVKLYKKVLDADERNKEGITPALKYLDKVKSISSLNEFNENSVALLLDYGMPMPFKFDVQPDMKNTAINSFAIEGPEMILLDTSFYDEDNETGKQLIGVYSQVTSKLLSLTPLSEEEQKQYLADTLTFDRNVSKVSKSMVEKADYVAYYNPMTISEAQEYFGAFDLNSFLKQLYGENMPDKIIAYDDKAVKGFRTYFNEENFEQYLHWAYVNLLIKACGFLSEELHTLSTTFSRTFLGIAKDPTLEKQAYQLASEIFSEPIGVYYGRTYFGEEAKTDVVNMVKEIIETYKERVANNDFLAASTKEKAILKLDTMKIKMGYPDKVDPFYATMKVDENLNLLDTMKELNKIRQLHTLNKMLKPVDRSEWLMPGHMVNACFNPFSNDITFPAAILQEPFYSLKQTASENLGGIGAVIGHEISHCFDNNGAKFDENGNLSDWWTENDCAEFKKKTEKMIKVYDGMDFHGGKVNGELIVSENIADNGGMAVTLAIMAKRNNADYAEYFRNWARIWCMKASPEYVQMALVRDVHAPNELRANIMPRNFEEWYKTFSVTENDGMFMPEDKRLIIW